MGLSGYFQINRDISQYFVLEEEIINYFTTVLDAELNDESSLKK